MNKLFAILIVSLLYISHAVAEPVNSVDDVEILSGDDKGIAYYVTLQQENQHWKINNISKDLITPEDYKAVEILGVSDDLKTIKPAFQMFIGAGKYSFSCSKGGNEYIKQRVATVPNVYNPCESQFTSVNKSKAIISNAFNTAFRLGLNVATGQVIYTVDTDKDKIKEIIKQTALIDKVKEYDSAQKLMAYRQAFKSAYTSQMLQRVIDEYKDNDPENLISVAITEKKALETKEMALHQKRLDEIKQDLERREAMDKANAEEEQRKEVDYQNFIAEQEKQKAVRHKQLTSEVRKFQTTIKIGSETNCGPVLEIKASLIKVYMPVKEYGNEHWLKKSSLYPSSYSCSFYNGQYVEPTIY